MNVLAKQFSLSLEQGGLLVAGPGGKAICLVTGEVKFSTEVKEKIKFAVTRKDIEGKKKVGNRQDLCSLSDDGLKFRFGFDLAEPGEYKVVVAFDSKHVRDSPLKFSVSEPTGASQAEDTVAAIAMAVKDKMKLTALPVLEVKYSTDSPASMKDIKSASHSFPTTPAVGDSPISTPLKTLRRPASQVSAVEVGATLGSTSQRSRMPVSQMAKTSRSQDPTTPPPDSTHNKSLPKPPLKTPQQPLQTPPALRVPRVAAATFSPKVPGCPLDLVSMLGGGPLTFNILLGIREGVKDEDLHRPIGLCLLQDGSLVVASTFEDKVKLYSGSGQLTRELSVPGRTFSRPSDMVTLSTGHFVVRDAKGITLFTSSGNLMRRLTSWQEEGQGRARCYGLAEDGDGRLVTIVEQGRGKASLLFFDLKSDKIVLRRDLADVVGQGGLGSKCRFLTHCEGKLYVTDLGLDQVYVLDCPSGRLVCKFGRSGTGPGCFQDPAGLGVDDRGNMVVADSKNHRLCLYSREGEYVATLETSPPVRRPSGLLVDRSDLAPVLGLLPITGGGGSCMCSIWAASWPWSSTSSRTSSRSWTSPLPFHNYVLKASSRIRTLFLF